MQTRSAILVLIFLFITLLSLASAYPQPRNLAIRAAGPPIVTKTSKQYTETSNRRKSTAATTKSQQEKKKEKHGEGLDHKESTSHSDKKSGGSDGGDGSSSSDDDDRGSGGNTCKVPLTTNFAKSLVAGHGCRKIAEAFETCNQQRVFCRDPKTKAQYDCLCSKKNNNLYSDALVEQCWRYLNDMHPQSAPGVREYMGLCNENF
ncbi:MAG: hypothetical protein Q9179_003135 [Wetmoreana sp. 5 TL-2023]